MIRVQCSLIAGLILAWVNAPTEESSMIVRFDGIGPVHVGMTLPELNSALHTSYKGPTDPEDEPSCFYVDVPNSPGLSLMVLNDRIARVDVDNPSTRTAKGVHIGDSESRAIMAYGKRLKIEPHHYVPENGHYLTILSAHRKYGIRFETEDGKITRYYAGILEAISYVEGCS